MHDIKMLPDDEKRRLLARLLAQSGQKSDRSVQTALSVLSPSRSQSASFENFPGYRELQEHARIFQTLEVNNPYFIAHEGVSDHVTRFAGKHYINYSGYNYLGLSGHPEVSAAAKRAIDEYGTSVSASRIVSGEIPLHGELESVLARIHDTEAALALVSGYATNVSVISHLFGPDDLVIHDALIHNSVIAGCKLSGARRMTFPHNDWQALDRLLAENREQSARVLIIIEGVYSMDGDIADLPRFIEIKKRHDCLLMVDEAHAAGVIGPHGLGSHNHFGIPGNEVDIWMGTLSKAFASCGGYICGSRALIDNLKYNAAGAILFSVGISPANTAAALTAANILLREPERAARLRSNSQCFIKEAKRHGLDTGEAADTGVIPVITGNSVTCLKLGQYLADAGIYVHPILYPAVPESAARLRFFITCNLTEEEVKHTVYTLATGMHRMPAAGN